MADPIPQRPQLFNFDAQGVRVVGTWDQPWFVAKDVCAALEIANSRDALATLEADEKGVAITDTLGGPQEMGTINESGLYALIFRSRKPSARLFRRWVTNEVLPAIRKTGRYVPPTEEELYARMEARIPPGVGKFAILPRHTGPGVEDLASENMSSLLSDTIGTSAGQWSGRISDLARVARENRLFHWLLRDPDNPQHRANLGLMLRRRVGIAYCGFGQTSLRLSIVGTGRGRYYVITRDEGDLGDES